MFLAFGNIFTDGISNRNVVGAIRPVAILAEACVPAIMVDTVTASRCVTSIVPLTLVEIFTERTVSVNVYESPVVTPAKVRSVSIVAIRVDMTEVGLVVALVDVFAREVVCDVENGASVVAFWNICRDIPMLNVSRSTVADVATVSVRTGI